MLLTRGKALTLAITALIQLAGHLYLYAQAAKLLVKFI